MLDAANREEAVRVMQGIQWAWDKRKTKPDDGGEKHPGGSKDDGGQFQRCTHGQEGTWGEEARNFGKYVKTVCDMIDVLDCGIDVEDYPRAMYEATRILESIKG